MKGDLSATRARLALAAVVALILAVAFAVHRHYPVSVLSGESSVGTWVSGFLLASCAAFCLAIAMKSGPLPWLPFMVFFILLALDERFMFHENIKRYILFSSNPPRPASSLIGEFPVILAGLSGAVVALFIRRSLRPRNRPFLMLAVAFGGFSVLLDVTHRHMVLEDLSKVLGEFCIACSLIGEIRDA